MVCASIQILHHDVQCYNHYTLLTVQPLQVSPWPTVQRKDSFLLPAKCHENEPASNQKMLMTQSHY